MTSVTVLRVKRKIGEDRVPVLVAESESKRRRIWKLSGEHQVAGVDAPPPRFNVLKREREDEQVVLELRRVRSREDATTGGGDVHDTHLDMLDDLLGDRMDEGDGWVYDTYYPVATVEALAAADAALSSNYGLLEHFDLQELVVEEEDEEGDEHDSEDSNAESYAGNDYPDEEDFADSDDERSDEEDRYASDDSF